MSISTGNLSEITVERGEPTLVPPAAEDTNNKGTLYFLSNLDINFQGKARTVYCFKPSDQNGGGHGDDEVLVGVIKNALSKALVHYYPVAGRLAVDSNGRPVVDCTGEGAVFVEAKADCGIEEIGNDTVAMEKLVYDTPDAKRLLEVPPLAAQVKPFSPIPFIFVFVMSNKFSNRVYRIRIQT
ncbi:hypothetical protein RHGRI_005584 [Rhododendron griersonianum]|uniref:Uncharacterized protein n=1 Tax=Rhododendron griersonianum TaxID=479676 RepID=A0AAV6LDW9_9ERIC|nr:hypothetical protein RHGRI_005584 [Rhododendron griersonianum]